MLEVGPSELLEQWLYKVREPSGNLYPSMDLIGSLRHSMLRVAGAPVRKQEDIMGLIRMETGTLWHDHFDMLWRKSQKPVMLEVRLTKYMPEGWSGRADWIVWSDEYRGFVLCDLKTTKSEGMAFLKKDGIKDAHLWQLSSYWHALVDAGFPMVRTINAHYLPMNPISGQQVKPELMETLPLPRDLVIGTMVDRAAQVKEYLAAVLSTGEFVNEFLAPVQPREQSLRWDGKRGVYEVKLLPNWSTSFCPYPPELCNCHEQGQTKLGEYAVGLDRLLYYTPRKGFEDEVLTVQLTDAHHKKLRGEG